MNNPLTGLLSFTAIWIYEPWLGFTATLALVLSTGFAILLGYDRAAIRAGLHGSNGILVGLGLGLFLSPHWDFVVICSSIPVTAKPLPRPEVSAKVARAANEIRMGARHNAATRGRGPC